MRNNTQPEPKNRPGHLDVSNWPAINLPALFSEAIPRFEHLSSSVYLITGTERVVRGISIWQSRGVHGRLGLFFPWVEVRPGVCGISDPMRLESNAVFLSSDGAPLGLQSQLLQLNILVHSIDWNPVATDHVDEARRRADIDGHGLVGLGNITWRRQQERAVVVVKR